MTLEAYLRGHVYPRTHVMQAEVNEGGVFFTLHPEGVSNVTARFKVEGNTLVPTTDDQPPTVGDDGRSEADGPRL